jgi:FHA domain-containing protein
VDEPLAVALKFGFLAVLYLFLLWVARSAMRDLSRSEGGQSGAERARESAGGPDPRIGVQPRLEVVAAKGYDPGTAFDLSHGATLGRADTADIPVDDPFASSAHARIFLRDEFMYIEDMGSTNGTYLNGRQLQRAERLKAADVVRIGDTEYRYQE